MGSGLCHYPISFISCTTLLRITLAKVCHPVSHSASQGIDSLVVHGSAKLLGLVPTLGSHAASWKSPKHLLELLSSTAIENSLNVVVAKLQTTHDVVHLSDSYWHCEFQISTSDIVAKEPHLVTS